MKSDEQPAASASSDVTAGQAPLLVAFDCTASAGNAPLSYLWDFGDGTATTGALANHTYTTRGSFAARCIVTDEDGDTAQATVVVDVTEDLQPDAVAVANPPSGLAPLEVSFQTLTLEGDAPIFHAWDFGDGNTATGANPTHTYTEAGVYNAVLTSTDNDGDTAVHPVSVTVGTNSLPAVAASATTQGGASPLTVQFRAEVAGGNSPLQFEWDFGNGFTESQVQNPTTIYDVDADTTFLATVTVTDADGDVAQSSVPVIVPADTAPEVALIASPSSGLSPLVVNFVADSASGNLPFSFQWDFGDGSSSTLRDPSHLYTHGGVFAARCTVTDADGDAASDQVTINVEQDTTPRVALSGGPLTGTAPLTVDLQSTVVEGNSPLVFHWKLGDGGTATTPDLSYTYANAGTYSLLLTVTDADGDTGMATLQVQVD